MKILVGISGGVDSAYAARLLIEQGHEVEGAVLVMHEYFDLSEPRRVADFLNIKLHEIDCTADFACVRENFVSEYSKGRTPNPCILCNPLVKFRRLYEYACERGFDSIATGHYARVEKRETPLGARYFFGRAADSRKDQSYMLYRLPQRIISMLTLPLSDLTKGQISAEAEAMGLSCGDTVDSQEICFIPSGDYASYIEEQIGAFPPGRFVDGEGNTLGTHKGIIHYTVGQRKGLGVSLGQRMFVSSIDAESSDILLKPEGSLTRCFLVKDLVFSGIAPQPIGSSIELFAKIRYQAQEKPARVTFTEEGAEVELSEPVRAVTPGQSCVLYDSEGVAFGGFISLE